MTAVNDTCSLEQCEPFRSLDAWVLWQVQAPRRAGGDNTKVCIHHDGSGWHSAERPAPPLSLHMAQQWLAYLRATGAGHDRPGEIGYVALGFRPENTGLAVVDIDDCVINGAWSERAQEIMLAFPGSLVKLSTSGRGLHVWFRYSGEEPGSRPTDNTGTLELYSRGRFMTADGRVLGGDAGIDQTPAMHALLAKYWPPRSTRPVTDSDWDQKTPEQRAAAISQLRSAFPLVSQDSYGDWLRIGNALKSLGDDGFELWHEFSRLHPSYDEREVTKKWNKLAHDRTDYRAIFATAQRNGWVNPESTEARIDRAVAGFAPGVPIPAAPAPAMVPLAPATSVTPTAAPTPPAPVDNFTSGDGGLVAATPANVVNALRKSSQNSKTVGRDAFKGAVMIGEAQGWREWQDEDYTSLRVRLEQGGFKQVPAEVAKSAVKLVAREHEFDSAQEWGGSLVWDGTPRVTTALHRYYGVADTPYTRAASEYLFSALGGRCMSPGCQADMALVLVGTQGLRKTSAVSALAPTEDSFVEINLGKRDEDLSRRLRGKLVAELAELRGLATREVEGIRAWVTRRTESWIPKYEEAERTFPRRFIAIGTVNGDEFLDDPEGERRWLPVRVGRELDIPALVADREQLWAEGIHLWRTGGVRWQDAQRLAVDEVGNYKVYDPWVDVLRAWLGRRPEPVMGFGADVRVMGDMHFTTSDAMQYALQIPLERRGAAEARRVAKVLKLLGYEQPASMRMPDGTKLWKRR